MTPYSQSIAQSFSFRLSRESSAALAQTVIRITTIHLTFKMSFFRQPIESNKPAMTTSSTNINATPFDPVGQFPEPTSLVIAELHASFCAHKIFAFRTCSERN